jgi:lambda repressor-like predicted transcriptional regulator
MGYAGIKKLSRIATVLDEELDNRLPRPVRKVSRVIRSALTFAL